MLRIAARFVVASPEQIWSPGEVLVDSGKVVAVGKTTDSSPSIPCLTLENSVVAPGLLNAHSHLEFSDLAAPFPATDSFPHWISEVVKHRIHASQQSQSEEEFQNDRRQVIRLGLQESYQAGVALIADIVTAPWEASWLDAASVEAFQSPEVLALPELIGLTPERLSASQEWAIHLLAKLDPVSSTRGISPHSPYSILWDQCQAWIEKQRQPDLVAMHVAESQEELEWLRAGTGPFAETFRRLGLPLPERRPQIEEILRFLRSQTRALLIHGNYLTQAEIQSLSGSTVSLVYCPRTHAHFQHEPYPMRELLDANVPVVLGTDSRASNPDLNLWREVVESRRHHSCLRPSQALASVTTAASQALGVEHRLGSIATGKTAFMIHTACQTNWTSANLLEELTSHDVDWQPIQPNRPMGLGTDGPPMDALT